jgi:membrane protein implicated in regulation of membrane protease activity
MNDYWVWWILATLLVGAELLTGTFYLLASASRSRSAGSPHGSAHPWRCR